MTDPYLGLRSHLTTPRSMGRGLQSKPLAFVSKPSDKLYPE